MTIPLLVANHITKTYLTPAPLTILRDISLTVERQQSVAIIGKSGEGKTTLLHILGTLEPPTTGELLLLGKPVRHRQARLRNRHIGFVFQAFHLLNDASALDNVLLPMAIGRERTGRSSMARERAMGLLQMVGLADRAHFPVKQLSGGEKQRVCIARAFANNPDIILADEPTGNLDHHTAEEIQTLLLSCVRDQGKALLLVTHNVAFAQQCSSYYQLNDGLLV